jgi:hypothetical protein
MGSTVQTLEDLLLPNSYMLLEIILNTPKALRVFAVCTLYLCQNMKGISGFSPCQ